MLSPESGCSRLSTQDSGLSTRSSALRAQQGLTLIELVVFIVIVSVALAGVLLVFTLTTSHSADPLPRKQALAIAESLLEEIELKDFAPGGYSGSDRSQFDDVGDYAGYDTASLVPPGIRAIDGTAIPDLAGYNAAVAVQTNQNLGPAGSVIANATLITVTVTDPGGLTLSLAGYRTNYAP